MHISEGILTAPVLISGMALSVVGTAIGLKKLDYDKIPQAGILSAVFFVGSLINIPVGYTNIHLVLNGMIGILMGWSAFPIMLVALLLQALFFQFGGITVLGINTLNLALPAILCHYGLRPFLEKKEAIALPIAFACGFIPVFLSALGVGAVLVFAEENFLEVAIVVVVSNIPLMLIEGTITVILFKFLKKVYPEMLSLTLSQRSSLL